MRLTFDGILILRNWELKPVQADEKVINKVPAQFIDDSFDEKMRGYLADMHFLKDLKNFALHKRDNINDETCELLEPYLRHSEDPLSNWSPWGHPVLDSAFAKKANGAAEGLCKFVGAMVMYHLASKIVKPKMDYLRVQEAKLEEAKKELGAAEAELQRVESEVQELDDQLQEAIAKKTQLEQNAQAMQKRMEAANRLLNGLSGKNI